MGSEAKELCFDTSSTRILMFHRVLDNAPAAFDLPSCYRMRGTALTTNELAVVLDKIPQILPLAAVEHALSLGEMPPSGCVLTFDDGYREHLDVVAPMLTSRGASATFYIATGLTGDGGEAAAVDAWYWLLDHAQDRIARISMPNGDTFKGRIDTHEGKTTWVAGKPKRALLAATTAQQATMVEELARSVACVLPKNLAARLYLREADWSTLVDLGMRVGAHSVRHPRLSQVGNDLMRIEVASSTDRIRRLAAPVPFAYPDGAYDARVVVEVRRVGVSSAVTCDPGSVRPGADLMRLPRVFVRPGVVRSLIKGPNT